MAAKALNTKNLLALGPDRLAELLIEVTKGRADLQRRLRLELSAHQGSEDVGRDIRKRYASIRQAKGYLSRKTHRAFAKEIRSMIALMETRVAPSEPEAVFHLLWELLHLAPGVLDRTKDGDILREAFEEAMSAVARLAPHLSLPPEGLADTMFDTLQHDTSGIFAGGIAALAPAFGATGLEHLKHRALAAMTGPPDGDALPRSGPVSRPQKTKSAQAFRNRWLGAILRDIADVQGDVDAYVGHFTPSQLTEPVIAVDVAQRLLAAGRTQDALPILHVAMRSGKGQALDDAYIACMEAAGRKEELKTFLWDGFAARPDAGKLRRYLRLLPDFDDIEAEDRARNIARAHPDLNASLHFFVEWPDLSTAASLVLARHTELDSETDGLSDLAEALDARFPLAAVLLRRKIIGSVLENGRAARYREAAALLTACAEGDGRVADHAGIADHATFLTRLRRSQARRQAFWKIAAQTQGR